MTQCQTRVQILSASLNKAIFSRNNSLIKDILESLQLQITDISKIQNKINIIESVRKLCKHKDTKISQISKALISKWIRIPTTESTFNLISIRQRGNVYIASMQRTKKWPEIMDKNGKPIKRINVTSGSNNKINGESAKQVSPMYLGPINHAIFYKLGVNNQKNDDEDALIFENYWQYGKIFKDLGHLDGHECITPKWLKFREKGYLEKKGH